MNNFYVMVIALVLLNACVSSNSGSVYSRDETRRAQTVKTGVVESVRAVKIEGTKSHTGTAVGGVVGGVLGSTIGHGRQSTVGAVLGAVAGGLAGNVLEEGLTRKDGLEITVRKEDDDSLLVIVQEADESFRVGDKVRLIGDGGMVRVAH